MNLQDDRDEQIVRGRRVAARVFALAVGESLRPDAPSTFSFDHFSLLKISMSRDIFVVLAQVFI